MAYVGLLLIVLADAAFHLLAPDRLGLRSGGPDLVLVTALFVGFHARTSGQLGLAVVLGALVDCFSATAIGHFAFLYGSAAYAAWRVRRFLPPDAVFSYVVASFFCGLLTAFLALFIALVTVPGPIAPGFMRAVTEAATSALFTPLFFPLLARSRLFRGALGGRRYEFA